MAPRKELPEAWDDLKTELAKVLEPPLIRITDWMDAQLRRWPWLYRKLGG